MFLPSLLMLCFAGSPSSAKADKPSAINAFQKSHDRVLKLVKDDAQDKVIEAHVDALLDYKWLADASLGGAKRAKKSCKPRCAEFEALLTKLIRANYLRRLQHAEHGAVEYTGEELRKNGTKAKVDTRVTYTKRGRAQQLNISYVMALKEGIWVCQNIITDGVSLAKTYKYEFNKILRDEGMDGLIGRLESKLAEVAKAP